MKHISILLSALSLCLLARPAAGEQQPSWPIRTLTFAIKDKTGWAPATATVPQGAEVRLSLENHSNAPACFEIGGKAPGRFVKSPECLDIGERRSITFFANVDPGSYPIRNRYEQQPAGTFTVR
jgi:hypothetical protein